ncbi:MAG: hypothetical protein JWM85_1973 [Acidimicrobiaceae bacterium]|nr:hypothetical protein [Acidimicrobiaceae bacterium]
MQDRIQTVRSREQGRRLGKALRDEVPFALHASWAPAPNRRDPLSILAEGDDERLADLVPVRYGRMVASPFAFLRGAAAIMAADLFSTYSIGLRLQLCGDAHLANFGVFGTPERNVLFDLTDFDETLPGPWEWDVKRLAASIEVAARGLDVGAATSQGIVRQTIGAYRSRMAELSGMGPLDVWYERTDVQTVQEIARQHRAKDVARQLHPDRVRQRTSLSALPKLTAVVEGRRRIIDDPPLIVHEDPISGNQARIITGYVESLPVDRRPLLERYTVADTARKVVGVGSVGTRCYLTLLMDGDGLSPLFLQLKQANEAVLSEYVGASDFSHQGERVVRGQRLMQSASDLFLGWTSYGGYEYYVRQFRDMKGSVNLDTITPKGLESYSLVCGRTLARAHARVGDGSVIAGYLGHSDGFDQAIEEFAVAYADQTERDHMALVEAVRGGLVPARMGA